MIAVHRYLGPGLLESAYEACLARELDLRGFAFERQAPLRIDYRGRDVACAYRIDLVVERKILIELKSVEALQPIHAAQTLTYMRLANLPTGLLVNFNVLSLRKGLRRFSLPPKSPS